MCTLSSIVSTLTVVVATLSVNKMNVMVDNVCIKFYSVYSCFPKVLLIAIFVIIIYIPYTCLSACNKLVLCLRYVLFLLLYARHIKL